MNESIASVRACIGATRNGGRPWNFYFSSHRGGAHNLLGSTRLSICSCAAAHAVVARLCGAWPVAATGGEFC